VTSPSSTDKAENTIFLTSKNQSAKDSRAKVLQIKKREVFDRKKNCEKHEVGDFNFVDGYESHRF
jgi:hypothetical protein